MSEHAVGNQLERHYRRIQMMIAPVRIEATDDSGPIHSAQVRVQGTPETIDNVGVMQIYGLASHAMPGTDATALFVSGDRSNVVVVATGNQEYRLRGLAPGEVALYTDEGDCVKLARGRIIEITAGETVTIKAKTVIVQAEDKMRVESPRLECTGEIIGNVP